MPASPDKPQIKVFISSPSDVRPERVIAQRVIERLGREFAHHLDVKSFLWEREPLLASEHFQENIPPPHESDIVVVILWSRLGVPLPAEKYLGPLSKAPVTGTEWEFEDALASYRERRLPDLLFYRKHAEVTAGLGDRQMLQDRLAQLDRVESFVKRWFLAADGSSFTAAVHAFTDAAEFEERLETHLRELLRKRLGDGADTEGRGARWHQAPFRGLLSFEFEHAPVFFGRARARNDLRVLLARRAEFGAAFVLVMGASGSGKSSLIKAGLLPDLAMPGMIERVALCRFAILRPSDAAGDPLRALAHALITERALPELGDLRHDADSLLRLLRAAPDQADVVIRQGLAEAAARSGLTERGEARLVVVVDQLEELFTEKSLTQDDRENFVRALRALACSGAAWVIATMRSDFFDRIETLPGLAELSRDEGRYLLLPPNDAEIAQMIRQPAREAGVRFEVDGDGIGLDDVIHEAASKDRSALPLLSFLLDQLWQRRADGHKLTFDAYRDLGGLEGALGHRAEAVFSELPPGVQGALPGVLRALVTVGEGSDRSATARSTPLSAFPPGSARRALIEALVAPEARLLVAEEEGGEARVRIAHEALLTHWPRARESIAEDMADLRLRARMESAAEVWAQAAPRDRPSLLLSPGKPLADAEDLLRRRAEDIDARASGFITASSTAYRNTRRRRIGAGLAAAATAAVIAIFASNQLREWFDYREQRRLEATRMDIRGTLVAFSAERGKVALDTLNKDSKNSPFLEALLRALNERALDVNTLFSKVTERVIASTRAVNFEQIPEVSTTLNGRIYLSDPPKQRKTFILSIGAADYRHWEKLLTAEKDAKDFAKAFDGLGYNVQLVLNPGHSEFVSAINSFTNMILASAPRGEPVGGPSPAPHRSLSIRKPGSNVEATDLGIITRRADYGVAAPRNTLAIIYLAGNGMRVGGVDYFVPVDFDYKRCERMDPTCRRQLVSVDDIVMALKSVAAVQVVIVDACRDDPFQK